MSIKVEHLSFSYGNHEVLTDISFEIPDRTLVNVLGHNGVGKSTLFKCILGLQSGYRGSIIINGHDAKTLSIKERAKEIAYIPQTHSSVYDYDVIDVVMMSTGANLGVLGQPKRTNVERAYDALTKVGIQDLARRSYTHISGGEQQLVLIARAIAQNARTIIMDEPTSSLDFGNTVRVLSCVKELAHTGLSIIQSTHQPDHAFLYSDKTLVIDKGRVWAYGDPKDVITSQMVKTIYGIDVEVNSLYDDTVRVCVPIHTSKNSKLK